MHLQGEAERAGGWVEALIGNHDLLLLAAHRFGDEPSNGPGKTFVGDWLANGGVDADLAELTDAHVAWLSARPATLRFASTVRSTCTATPPSTRPQAKASRRSTPLLELL